MSRSSYVKRLAWWLVVATIGILSISGNAIAQDQAEPNPVQADFYVACDGKDNNPGTSAAPFATLTRARDAVREKIAKGLARDVLVLIRGGVYRQADTLAFGVEDSGSETCRITYAAAPGEAVVLNGGRKITGWKQGEGEIWTTEIPEVKAGKWAFRQLFVGGNRAVRARTPNVDAEDPWWLIRSSSSSKDNPAPPEVPVVLAVSGRIADYSNPTDIEFAYTCNNDMGRKRLASLSVADQTFTLATPNRWNPRVFAFDWYLSIPTAGPQGQFTNRGYLENAREMLDQPGEWYLDRKTGVLSYWPRAGEDLTEAEVIAPVVRNTLLAIAGTPDRPVQNVHLRGIRCEYVDWSPPEWGYMGLFCCNIAVAREPNPGHRFIDAMLDISHARACSFCDGGVVHGGAMGICLREGTSQITLEGNEIGDLGGGGIGLGGCNVAAGYTKALPPPQPGEYTAYRVANNHVHHCGTDYYGAVGIALFLMQNSVITNNLIHDTAYFGLCAAGSQDPKEPFAKNNIIQRNHIYNAMKVTVDGAGMYVTMGFYDRGALIRDNLIHDIIGKGPCGGLYIDTNNSACRYENNVIYQVPSGRPLIVNFSDAKNNTWCDNLIQTEAALPKEFLDAMEAYTGLEPDYQRTLLKTAPVSCDRYALTGPGDRSPWSAIQFDLSQEGRGVVQVILREGAKDDGMRLKLQGLAGESSYELRAYASPGQIPMIGKAEAADVAALGLVEQVTGRDLLDKGLALKPGKSPQVIWILYQRRLPGVEPPID